MLVGQSKAVNSLTTVHLVLGASAFNLPPIISAAAKQLCSLLYQFGTYIRGAALEIGSWKCRTVVAVAGNDYCIVAGSTRLSTGYSILTRDRSMITAM